MKQIAALAAAAITAVLLPLLMAAVLVTTTTATAIAVACTTAAMPATGDWRPPYEQAYHVGSRGFGMRFHPIHRQWRMHTGQDMTALPTSGLIVAAAAGTIRTARYTPGLGNHIIIDHGGDVATVYGHLASIEPDITPGAPVRIGQRLGLEGSTGMSTGAHLHFEVHVGGAPTDPIAFMLDRGAPLTGAAVAPSPPPDAAIADPGGRQGGIGFPLPPPGTPLLNANTNPALPIPPDIEALYRAAAQTYQLPWTLLAGIGMAETAHGATTATSSAGAQGLMQFMPATFAAYGVDGDGDGRADIRNDADSIHSAANYLTASGVTAGPDGVRRALFAYNHADWYVNDVLHYAHTYGGGTVPGDPSDCGPTTSNGNPNLPPLDAHQIETVLAWATAQIGAPYRLGANGPHAWDCSSFTQAAYHRIGITLPRTAAAQRNWLAAGNGHRITPGQEQPGDLIFIDSYLGPNQIGHVVIVHDPATTTTIEAGGTHVGHDDYGRYQATKTIYEIWRVGDTST